MELNIYAIYDDQAKAYMQPFFLHNHALAVRAFTDQVNSKSENNPLTLHPEHFTLFYIGQFDDQTGNLELRDHQSLGKGISYKESSEDQKIIDQVTKEIKTHIDEVLAFNKATTKLEEVS